MSLAPYKITNKGYAAKLAIKGFALDLTLSTFPSFWLGGPTHLHEMEAMKNETYYFIELIAVREQKLPFSCKVGNNR